MVGAEKYECAAGRERGKRRYLDVSVLKEAEA